ncbi:hypothetical protein ABMY26_06800 (plasmid) [Azospirillum sp. HJ39]|uniref:hypothetical protein n=1 Tax=Azospirillum sp. HJ39 TaxID=3159496 RepID=UPI0035565B1F
MRVFLTSVRYSPKRTSAVGDLYEIIDLKPLGGGATYKQSRIGEIKARGKDIKQALVAKAQEMLASRCADEKVKIVFDHDTLHNVAHGRA